tara:strand:+ start:274 stop:444 length:171 start_codon:yes stop_codon:yes gene_type:complete
MLVYSENIATMLLSTVLSLVRSVPVHSMKTSLVSLEMREWLPLMMGGSESTVSVAS